MLHEESTVTHDNFDQKHSLVKQRADFICATCATGGNFGPHKFVPSRKCLEVFGDLVSLHLVVRKQLTSRLLQSWRQ